ncbi:putative GPI anchored dioxygenase [Hypoxylon fragiforme]|uniref:putative GPI anchored dioxygenase n=1 Tax=Hypoxylon fragiforme TaxID=63214 RepID=UPI0020C6A09C|nr:putative GPI anchored dioxygenase [Hypoxylon fragiforme]KAI2604404.1 putative GPI anchored dioxygenase [Hypoxylon fragiforme]
MVFVPSIAATLAAALALTPVLVAGHPGEKYGKREAMEEMGNAHVVSTMNARALEACQNSPAVKARKERAGESTTTPFILLPSSLDAQRHSHDFVGKGTLRTVCNIPVPTCIPSSLKPSSNPPLSPTTAPWLHRRDAASLQKWAAQSHDKTGTVDFDKDTPISDIFGSNTSCVLTPDNANGPYFVYQERIRSDVVEGTAGVPLHLELQFIDVQTCAPAGAGAGAGLLIDTWSCNATGAYSGVSARGEGGLGTTYLRGAQVADGDGVVSFDTIFPGHYQGRATHQHLIAHVGARVLPNGTYSGGTVAHLSQLFFDQALRDAVEATPPYSANTIPHTPNLRDWFTGYAATPDYDPFPNYVMLGGSLDDGLFLWAELGLNTSSNWDYYAPYAATWKEGGGYDNPDFDFRAVASPPPTHG